MKSLVTVVSDTVPRQCHSTSCSKEGCTLSVRTPAAKRVLVDLDCNDLHIPHDRKRGDYVFVGEKRTKAWVALIELKRGRFKAAEVVEQLQGGAETVEEKTWLPDDGTFRFVPVLVHGGELHHRQRIELHSCKVRLRGQRQRVAYVRCGGKLKDAFKLAETDGTWRR